MIMASQTVQEIMDAFEKLPQEEQFKVIGHLHGILSPAKVNPPTSKVSEEFKQIASEVFNQNDELFRKLAK